MRNRDVGARSARFYWGVIASRAAHKFTFFTFYLNIRNRVKFRIAAYK